MIVYWNILLFVAIGVQQCSGLDIKWYSWLDGSRLPASLNVSTCGSCQEQMLRYLDEVQQDITYANKTIDAERILSKLSQRLEDIGSTCDRYATSYKQSSEGLNYTAAKFIANYHELNQTTNLGNDTHRIINGIESKALRSKEASDKRDPSPEHVKLRSQGSILKLHELIDTHQHQVGSISHTKTVLLDMAHDFKRTNQTHRGSQFGDLIEHSAKHLEFTVHQSNQTLRAQAKDGIRIDSIYTSYVTKLHQLTNVSQEFEIQRGALVAQLILDKIYPAAQHRIMSDEHLEVGLRTHLIKYETSLNKTRETSAHLSDLKHSMNSNDEREADERLVLAESHKDIKNLVGKLEKLSQRLKSFEERKDTLKLQLDRLESLDLSALVMVKNLTVELSNRNMNVSRWFALDLSSKRDELIQTYDAIVEKFSNDTRQLHEWFDLLDLASQLEYITTRVYEINSTIASVNKTMDAHNLLVTSQEDLTSNDPVVALLNATKSVKSTILLANDNQLNQLKQHVLSLMSDIDQSRVHLNETQEILKRLDAARSSNEPNLLHDRLTKVIEESSRIEDHITSNLTVEAEDILERFTRDAANLLIRAPETSSIPDRDDLVAEISISSEKFDALKNRVIDNLNATRVVNQTKIADIDIRASLTSLQAKVGYARSLLNQLNLGRREEDSNTTISTSSSLQLSIPRDLIEQSSYSSISFLIEITRIDTDEVPLIVLSSRSASQSKYIMVKLTRGHLTFVVRLGSNALTEIRDDEVLHTNQVYRVLILKIGAIINISIQSNHSTGSMTRTLKGPYITFDLSARTSEIYIGGFPSTIDKSSDYFRDHASENTTHFTGQIDDLQVNGHKFGLWNSISPSNTKLVACQPLVNDTQQVSGSNHSSDKFSKPIVEAGRMASFPRPRSNISSSFVQLLHSNSELDELLIEKHSGLSGTTKFQGHIRELTISFKTNQTNGLLIHHARPDHSSFLSLYISGGRLMLAFNFDKKIRFESHFSLSDNQWHYLNLVLHHGAIVNETSLAKEVTSEIKHSLIVILDDKHLYHEDYNLTTTHEKTNANSSERATNSATTQDHDLLDGREAQKKLLYFGGLEDKYSPLLRSQQIPTNFHGCLADVTINKIWINLANTNRSPDISLANNCDDETDTAM